METINLLAGQVPLKKYLDNKDKYIRQLRSVVKWKNAKCIGSLVGATAFGKTFVARIALGKIQKSGKRLKVIIIVPRLVLKTQWEQEVAQFTGLDIQVHVINGFVKDQSIKQCDLLILDEMHLYASDKFYNWTKTKYRWLLGLTATMKRLDGREDSLIEKAPVFDNISQQECLDNGWISDYIEINCPVSITKKERREQNELSKKIATYFNFFGDFGIMSECCNSKGASNFVNSRQLVLRPNEVSRKANIAMKLIRKRKDFIENNEHKLRLAKKLLSSINLKTITFSESVDFAENLKKSFSKASIYHSSLKTINTMVEKVNTKTYKTITGRDKYVLALREKGISPTISQDDFGYTASYNELKVEKLSQAKQKVIAINEITAGVTNKIFTAKALDQGFNVDDMEFGLETSRSRNPTQRIQRTGRLCRLHTYGSGKKKIALYISLYIPDYMVRGSIDEDKLMEVSSGNAIWVDDEEEMFKVLTKYQFI